MSNTPSDVSLWLHTIDRHPKEEMSLYIDDYKRLAKLAPINPVRVLKNPEGEPRVMFIDCKETVTVLKSLYAFQTKKEAAAQIKDALTEE